MATAKQLTLVLMNVEKICGAMVLGACFMLLHPAQGEEQPTGEWKFSAEELARYYEGKGKPPPWSVAVVSLLGKDSTKAAQAGGFLLELVARVLADETSGTSRWRATPYWGSEGENPARNLRGYMISSIAEKTEKGDSRPAAVIPLLDWFIRKEPVVEHRLNAMKVLEKLDGKEADDLIKSLAADESLIHWLSASVIKRATERDLDLPETALLSALSDHHGDRRSAAALHWKKQTGNEPSIRFVPAEAIQSPKIRDMLDAFGTLLIDPLPADAPWIEVERTWESGLDDKQEKNVESSSGWLVKRDGDELNILDLHGRIQDVTLGKNPNDGWRGDSTVTFKEQPIAGLVEQIEALRKTGDPDSKLSAQGSLSGQFQGEAAGVPEMLLALQLHRLGKPDLCARILFPALDTHSEDKVFFEVAKHRLATGYGYRMFVEFVGNRAYDKALVLAARIDRDFKDTRFHQTARRFLADLPKRRDDFRGLTLPTRAGWESWKAKHSREEQIKFLCERLRLMNCYQYGQPSDVDWFDQQFAEPCGLMHDASYGLSLGKTRVINPLEELMGNPEPHAEDEDGDLIKLPPIPGLGLGIRDVAVIAPFLREDQLILSVGFWRNFHPSRTVIGTRELLAWVLRKTAKRELVNEREWAKLDDAQIAARIDAMVAWAKERSDRSETELLLESLTNLAEDGSTWHEASNAANELVKLGERRAFPLIVRWLKHPETDDYEIEQILPLIGQLDAGEAKVSALAYLDHKDPSLRLHAAMIVLKAGDEKRALSVIGKAFAEANHSNVSGNEMEAFVTTVLKLDSPEAWDAVAMVFDDIGIATINSADGFDRVAICRALEAHANPAGLKFYRALLDNRDTGIPKMVSWSRPITHMFGEELLEGYAGHDETAKKILADTKADSEERLVATKSWLDGRLSKLRK